MGATNGPRGQPSPSPKQKQKQKQKQEQKQEQEQEQEQTRQRKRQGRGRSGGVAVMAVMPPPRPLLRGCYQPASDARPSPTPSDLPSLRASRVQLRATGGSKALFGGIVYRVDVRLKSCCNIIGP